MRDAIRAVVIVLVDRKSEASMELWTVESKLCGGWRGRLHSWMLRAYSTLSASLLDFVWVLENGKIDGKLIG